MFPKINFMKIFNSIALITALLSFLSTESLAQNREFGIALNGFDNFSAVYKVQQSENSYTNYQFLYLSGNAERRGNLGSGNLGLGFLIVNEKRKNINEKFVFVNGLVVGLSISYLSNSVGNTTNNALTFSPEIGYLVGGQYHISDEFYISLDVSHTLRPYITVVPDGNDNTYGIQTEFNSDAATLSFVYKF